MNQIYKQTVKISTHLGRLKKPRKLSKMQKAILKSLYRDKGRYTEVAYLQPIGVTSRNVAQPFNKEQSKHEQDNDRVLSQYVSEITSLFKRLESDPQDKNLKVHPLIHLIGLELARNHLLLKSNTLSPKHSASFSRSIRRLEERGLLMRVTRFELKDHLLNIYTKNTDVQRTRYLFLTAEGIMASKRLFD